ncbi:MAG: DNA-binding response regulator [Caldilinea sp. CFX5]|nr:DNA-binding response regulator [Caldilinea sp. CFX5]
MATNKHAGSGEQTHQLLFVHKDVELSRLVQQSFVGTTITVHTAENGRRALRQLYDHHPDLILLDFGLPPLDGQPLLTYIREITNTPVMALVERDDSDSLVNALDQDLIVDTIMLPFSLRFLLARVKAFFRLRSLPSAKPTVAYADAYLTIDNQRQRVLVKGKSVHLTTAERKLLLYLVAHAEQICNYAELLDHTWGWEYRESIQYVHVYISRLRRKIEPDPKHPRYLHTIHGIGYQFQKQR